MFGDKELLGGGRGVLFGLLFEFHIEDFFVQGVLVDDE